MNTKTVIVKTKVVLGIDPYVGKLVRDAVKKVIRLEHSRVKVQILSIYELVLYLW